MQAIHLYSCLSLWPPGSSLVPIFVCAYAILELRSCHVSYPLVTPKQTLLPPLPSYYPLIDVCCLASRSACLGSAVYLDLISGYVGRLIHDSFMVNVGKVNNDKLLL